MKIFKVVLIIGACRNFVKYSILSVYFVNLFVWNKFYEFLLYTLQNPNLSASILASSPISGAQYYIIRFGTLLVRLSPRSVNIYFSVGSRINYGTLVIKRCQLLGIRQVLEKKDAENLTSPSNKCILNLLHYYSTENRITFIC